ncbi:hypothetical protein DY245_34250, partial [Streptomyces inhibens]
TFGTLLSSQGTDASFGFPLGFPPGASLLCFTLYQAFSGFRTAAFLQTCRSAQFLSRDQDAEECRPPQPAAVDCVLAVWGRSQTVQPCCGRGKSIRRDSRCATSVCHAEPSVLMTYASERCAVQDR